MVPGGQPSPPLREISRLVILKMYSFRLQPPYGKRLEKNEFAQQRYAHPISICSPSQLCMMVSLPRKLLNSLINYRKMSNVFTSKRTNFAHQVFKSRKKRANNTYRLFQRRH